MFLWWNTFPQSTKIRAIGAEDAPRQPAKGCSARGKATSSEGVTLQYRLPVSETAKVCGPSDTSLALKWKLLVWKINYVK